MKKYVVLLFTLISINVFSQKNNISLQGGVAMPSSSDMIEISKTIGYCTGVDYFRTLYSEKKYKYTLGLIVDFKTALFRVADNFLIEGNPYSANVTWGHSYREFSFGLGLSPQREIGNSGFFVGVNTELIGLYNIEPSVGFSTYIMDDYGNLYSTLGDVQIDNGLSIGYDLGVSFYKMFFNNFGIGLQIDWLSSRRTTTTYTTITTPVFVQSQNDVKEKIDYLCGQLKCVYSF